MKRTSPSVAASGTEDQVRAMLSEWQGRHELLTVQTTMDIEPGSLAQEMNVAAIETPLCASLAEAGRAGVLLTTAWSLLNKAQAEFPGLDLAKVVGAHALLEQQLDELNQQALKDAEALAEQLRGGEG